MRGYISATVAWFLLRCIFPSQSFTSKLSSRSVLQTSLAVQKRQQTTSPSEIITGAKTITDGSLVEYTSTKGTKRLAIVSKRSGAYLDVLNDARKSFTVPISRVTYHINGSFAFGDLLRLNEILGDLKPIQVERLWESSFGQKHPAVCNLNYISKQIFGSTDAVRTFASMKLMSTYGTVFFEQVDNTQDIADQNNDDNNGNAMIPMAPSPSSVPAPVVKEGGTDIVFVPLSPNAVQQNLRSRAALREFKQRFMKVMTTQTRKGGRSGSNAFLLMPDMPDRVQGVVADYAKGLKHLMVQGHPWVINGWGRKRFDEKTANKGREFLEFLELGPNPKNARKVLEMTGIWPAHTNVEKYIMGLRDKFPVEVLDEAQYLLDNADVIPDPDERLRRDLRHLGSYAVDREGATEVDDAVSLERLEDGREKLWIHIADVSRWIRPGSQLSLEAERRMVSVYMPDERISMFPYTLSTELLSLGAGLDSYALSCGVTLDELGEVTSFEVCPSRVRITRRLSYTELDDLLAREENTGRVVESLLTAAPADKGDVDGEYRVVSGAVQAQGEGSLSRGYLDSSMKADLSRLNYWAKIRHSHRNKKNALDQYLRHKTELSLSVRTDQKTLKYVVSGFTTWSNATSTSLVSEFMILMCETVGGMCQGLGAPVLYKTQAPHPPLSSSDLSLQDGETPFLRSARIMRHLRAATDSKHPGPHCTSGSVAYVQCTSPIRRYHDLYNHYRLKAAMHGASMGEEWATNNRAEEEAGIMRLDSMATSEQRLQTLNAVRLVSRHREQYWLSMYVNKLVSALPRVEFQCLVVGPQIAAVEGANPFTDREEEFTEFLGNRAGTDGEGEGEEEGEGGEGVLSGRVSGDGEGGAVAGGGGVEAGIEGKGVMYDALVLQLGSFFRYALYSPASQPPRKQGELLGCHLFKRYTSPVSYLLVPSDFEIENLPKQLADQLARPKKNLKEDSDSDSDSDSDGDGEGENNSDADSDGEGEGDNDDNLDSVSSAESAGLGVRMG